MLIGKWAASYPNFAFAIRSNSSDTTHTEYVDPVYVNAVCIHTVYVPLTYMHLECVYVHAVYIYIHTYMQHSDTQGMHIQYMYMSRTCVLCMHMYQLAKLHDWSCLHTLPNVYVFFQDEDVESMQMGYISFSENRVSKLHVYEYVVHLILKGREPRIQDVSGLFTGLVLFHYS